MFGGLIDIRVNSPFPLFELYPIKKRLRLDIAHDPIIKEVDHNSFDNIFTRD